MHDVRAAVQYDIIVTFTPLLILRTVRKDLYLRAEPLGVKFKLANIFCELDS